LLLINTKVLRKSEEEQEIESTCGCRPVASSTSISSNFQLCDPCTGISIHTSIAENQLEDDSYIIPPVPPNDGDNDNDNIILDNNNDNDNILLDKEEINIQDEKVLINSTPFVDIIKYPLLVNENNCINVMSAVDDAIAVSLSNDSGPIERM
jgi:hypothetical protein